MGIQTVFELRTGAKERFVRHAACLNIELVLLLLNQYRRGFLARKVLALQEEVRRLRVTIRGLESILIIGGVISQISNTCSRSRPSTLQSLDEAALLLSVTKGEHFL